MGEADSPSPQGRAAHVCVWVVSTLILLLLLAGGGLLVLYVVLPETKATAWFPVAGLVLIGLPWGFWIVTCSYRCLAHPRRPNYDEAKVAPVRSLSPSAAAAAATDSARSGREVGSDGDGAADVVAAEPGVLTREKKAEEGTSSPQAAPESEASVAVLIT